MTNPGEKELKRTYVNPLSPSIHMQILQTDLHTSTLRISWENLIKYHGIFFMVIILLILITLSLDSVWILLGENWCWTLLGLKGFFQSVSAWYQRKNLLQRNHGINQSTDLQTPVFHGQFSHWRCVVSLIEPDYIFCFLRQKRWLRAGNIPFQKNNREKLLLLRRALNNF